MKISIIGAGYVGLVTGLCLAEKKHDIICVDNNKTKVKKINNGKTIIHEEGLDALLSRNLNINFRASSNLHRAVLKTDVTIIAVGTPFNGKSIDLTYVKNVSKSIGQALYHKKDYHLVVVKSTVTPGTTDDIVLPIVEKYSKMKVGEKFGIGMNPEFLREGSAVKDFMNPDRIVIGSNDKFSAGVIKKIYKPFTKTEMLLTNNKTAEMIKYANNTLLATLISFSNEIGNLCATQKNVDSLDVMKGVHLDNRITPIINSKKISPGIISYLSAGCGFGGSCFPKDLSAIISFGKKKKQKMQLLNAVQDVNQSQPMKIIEILNRSYKNNLKEKNIAVLGLAFKEGTDDMRESPSIAIINKFIECKANVIAYDPVAQMEAKKILESKRIVYAKSIVSAVKSAEIIVVLTAWPEFKNLHNIINNLQLEPLIVDGRRFLNKKNFQKYIGIGIT